MIPSTAGLLKHDITVKEQPSLTYRMDLDEEYVRGYADKLEAVKQAVFRILSTERYQHVIYPWYYGIETIDLYGEPVTYIIPEIERRITEALMTDNRVTGVGGFTHDISAKGILHTNFIVQTIFGETAAQKEVNVGV